MRLHVLLFWPPAYVSPPQQPHSPAGDGACLQRPTGMELPSPLSLPTTGRVTLDEAREWLYVSLRAGERQAEGLKKLCAALDERKPGEEWLDALPLAHQTSPERHRLRL